MGKSSVRSPDSAARTLVSESDAELGSAVERGRRWAEPRQDGQNVDDRVSAELAASFDVDCRGDVEKPSATGGLLPADDHRCERDH